METKGFMNMVKSRIGNVKKMLSANESLNGTVNRVTRPTSGTGLTTVLGNPRSALDKKKYIKGELGGSESQTNMEIIGDYFGGMNSSGQYDATTRMVRQGTAAGTVAGGAGIAGATHHKKERQDTVGRPY